MVQNYLSISGTIQGVQGNDAKAPYAYWNDYAYRPVTSGELSSLINGDFQVQALSLAPGEYTCLEISFSEPVYASQFRCYLSSSSSPIEVTLSYPHRTENPSSFIIDLSDEANVSRENVYGLVRYYDRISSSTGYAEGEAISLLVGEYAQLISADYEIVTSENPNQDQTGFADKVVKQVVHADGDYEDSHFIKVSLKAPPANTVDLDWASIAPVNIQEERFNFDRDTLDDDRRDELRYWYSDQGKAGHFEGQIFSVDEGATITGTWNSFLTWSGVGPKENLTGLNGHTVRQTIPARALQYLGDGLRVTLSGSPDQDILLNHMSYMPSNSTGIRLEFGSTLDIYRENIQHDIVRWKNDGGEGSGWEAALSRHSGHFEGAQVDIEDGASAVMFTENIIGIPAVQHGLKAGDYICIYGTEFYDGYYYVLSYSPPGGNIVYIWGIFDPEVFTAEAKIRRVISLGPKFDDYGVKQDCRAVVPFVEVNFSTGQTAYILDYTDFGKLHASVKLGPDEIMSENVVSIYDVTVDDGWLCNSPGVSIAAESVTSIPDTMLAANKKFWPPRFVYNDAYAVPDIGYQENRIISEVRDSLWGGRLSCISESQDPEYEGNKTGWPFITQLFDRKMAQPWSIMDSEVECKYVSMSYRGPIPVKFIIDMDEPRLFNRYRFWVQTAICPSDTTIAFPRSWKVEGSSHGDNNLEWDVLQEKVGYDKFTSSNSPPDSRIPNTCSEGEWESYKNLELYRYYRFHIYESWDCTRNPQAYECCHIDEIDFVEHISSAGIFPVIVNSPLYIGNIDRITPDEHLRGGSQVFYAISFDGGLSYESYSLNLEQWRTIVRVVGDQWQYFDGTVWRATDPDKPQENTVRFALWYAFSVKDNRMDSEQLQMVSAAAYTQKIPAGGYLKFAVGLLSTGKIEAVLKAIVIQGTVFNPAGTESPTEITFNNGQHGCNILAGQSITSDWINDDLLYQKDALFVMDFDTTATSIPVFNGYGYNMIYFHRSYVPSYDLQTVDTLEYTLASGVVLIDHVESRQSDTVTLPVTGHNLPEGAYIRVSGTFDHYDGYHDVRRSRPGAIEIPSKHWLTDNPVPAGAYAQRRYSIGPGNMQPHAQVGSILEFSDIGGYLDTETTEGPAAGFYYATATAAAPMNPPANVFDPDVNLEYHSGQPISYGSVGIGVYFKEAKIYDRFRLKSSLNDQNWWKEYPSVAVVGGSNSTDPALDSDLPWTVLWSGSVATPIGPGRFSDWNMFTSSGSYSNYRLKVLDNHGEWYDCIRFSEIDFFSSEPEAQLYTVRDIPLGFDSKYLLDQSSSSEYAVLTTSGYPTIALDFRNKEKELTRFRFQSTFGYLLSDPALSWSLTYPKNMALFGSKQDSPLIDQDVGWDLLVSYSHPLISTPGAWGDWVNTSSGIDPYRYYKIVFYSNQASISGGSIRLSELAFETVDTPVKVNSLVHTDNYPTKLFDLPPWYEITGGLVQVQEGFTGGYAEQAGNVASGTYNNSFWTIVDRHWQLQNSRAIEQIGIYSDQATTITFKMFTQRASSEWFDITDVEAVTHSGSGFQWFTLTQAYTIPDTGDCYLGWYQASFPVKMAEAGGSGSVSYQYGNYAGINIHLPLSNSMKPCLAVRYSDCFSIGTDANQDLLVPLFSPARGSLEWSLDPIDYSVSPRALNVYRRCSLTQSGTQGSMKIKIYYRDIYEDTYGALDYGVQDNGHLVCLRVAKNLVDSDAGTDLFSYKELGQFSSLAFVSSFYNEVRLVAFRYRPGSVSTPVSNYFPPVVELYANQSWEDPSSLTYWESLYKDSSYTYGSAPDYWGPWVYIDSYVGSYRYYLFRLSFLNASNFPAAVGDVELLVEYNNEVWVVVPEQYNAIANISQEGMFDGQVTARSHPGESRQLSRILNTFSSYNQNELSPGTYFYRGENTPWDTNLHPVQITKLEGDISEEVGVTHPFFAGMHLLAWHPLDEESGDFRDLSGNEVEAFRVGQLDHTTGRRGWGAAYKEDTQEEGSIRFTLPSHLEEYTVSFWFMAKHEINFEYETKFDIMGGWASYGAIPGIWHISMSKHMMYETNPYPPVNDNSLKSLTIGGESHQYGRICFGNYGARIETSRDYWQLGVWYHVAFAFRAGATASSPYKCWINGVPDVGAHFYSYDQGDAVYPPSDVIMVDPSDIHYDTHNYHNCMYFGLPLEDGSGLPYEFGLQHVMHFNTFLTDSEVFSIFRARLPLSDEWSGIYFPDTEMVETPGSFTFDFGEPKCVTKYGLIVPSGVTDRASWQFMGSGIQGTVILHEANTTLSGVPDYYNILNSQPFQYYVINFLDSDVDYVLLNGIRLVDVPQIPTVSGSYQTIASGVQDLTLLELNPIMTPGVQIDFTISWDQGDTWSSGIDRCDLIGSGIYTKHVFTSDPIMEYPSVSIESRQTDWSTSSPTEIVIPSNFSNGATVESDWLRYALSQSTHHLISFTFSSIGDNTSFSEEGYGYVIAGAYTCSGTYLLSELEARKNEIVSLPAASVVGVIPGEIVGLQNSGPYSGRWPVAEGMSGDLRIYAPYEVYQVGAGAQYRRALVSAFNPNSEIILAGDTSVIISTSGNVIELRDDPGSQEVVAVYDSIVASQGLQPITDTALAAAAVWDYAGLGRLSRVDVISDEPNTTHIFHGITFDEGMSYTIRSEDSWLPVVRFNGVWQYHDGSWHNSSENTVYGAFREAVEEASQMFSTSQLEAIEEACWHETGAINSPAGTLGFIQYMFTSSMVTPTLSGYNLLYQALPAGITDLIPSGYSYATGTTSGTYIIKTLLPDIPAEENYDRKLIQHMRVYLTNTAVSSRGITEAAIIDVQTPDDPHYLTPPVGAIHNRDGDFIYTGGTLLQEGQTVTLQLPDIPASKKIYYAEARLYYDTALGAPSGTVISTWKRFDNYLSSFIWSDLPVENYSVTATNTNASGIGPQRIYALALYPATYSGIWNIENNFNLLESGHTTTVTGVDTMPNYTFQVLSTPHLERLITETDTPVPLLPGYAIGLESDFNQFGGKSQEIRVYIDAASGVDINFMTQVSGIQTWNTYSPTWNGTSFSYIFREPENATRLKINIGNSNQLADAAYSQIRWIRAVQLINCGDEIDFGRDGTGDNALNLPTYYTDYNKISIFNNNRSGTMANARVLPRFSGNYHLDRTIRISEDTINWGTIEDGVRFPEDYPWEMGKLINTRVSEDQVFLSDTEVSGTWRSPVIEVLDPSSTAAYVYVRNIQYDQAYINEDYVSINNIMKVRSSYEKPMQLFMATAVNTENEAGTQAPWKAVLFKSDGSPVHTIRYSPGPTVHVYNGINVGALDAMSQPRPPRRYWSNSQPYLWQFYGALDSRGFAGLTMGLQWSVVYQDFTSVQYDNYKFYQAFPESGGPYDASWGDNESSIHIFESNWVYLPIFNRTLREVTRVQGSTPKHSWQMVDVVYRPTPFYELYQEHYFSDKVFHARNLYKFKGTATTPEHDCEFDYLYSFEGTMSDLENDGIRCAACCDNIVPEDWGDYYWMHYACDYSTLYYKTLLVNGTSVEKEFSNIERKFNFMVEAGEGTPTRGFWGITQDAVYWYSYNGTSLIEEFGVTADNRSSFKRIHHGCTDYMNNLWFVDLATERVIRVNYRTQAVDYSRVVPGVSSVTCDPYDNSAYLYVLRSPEFPTQDCIKLVHVGDYDYLEPETVCSVPNVSMLDSFNINLIGRSTSPMGYYDVLPEDPLWGEGAGSIPWVNYSAASPTLPKGIYKQFKLTLRRSDLEAASPEIEYLRIPVPAIINKIPWKGYKDIFVDTIPRSENYDLTAGTHTLDLLVWWTRE